MIKIPYYETSNFVFSNFSSHSVKIEGVLYPTAEHAYHAAKFEDKKVRDEIKNADSPLEAFQLAKKYKPVRKENWDEIKVNNLYEIIKEKTKQHDEVRNALLATGNEEIIEDNPHDDFWGNGQDGKGQNHTGKILMRIRSELKSQ
jgi:N-glycosidase YbiA